MNFYDVLAAEKWVGGIPTINFFDLLFAQSISGEQWQVYEGTLPATLNANGDNLRQYQVWGNTGGVGDRTVQLFDKSTAELYPFQSNGSLFPASTGGGWVHSDYIECQPGETYTAYMMSRGGANTYHCIYDENKTFVRSILVVANQNAEITFASGEKYIRLSVRDNSTAHEAETAMFFSGTTPPENYVPFGYEVDISTSDGTNATTTPIYIGDEPLDKDEYIDYQAGKIYRMINSVLTPTDPPVPLQALPTCEGTTMIEYAGQSVAPEKVLLEYAKGGN